MVKKYVVFIPIELILKLLAAIPILMGKKCINLTVVFIEISCSSGGILGQVWSHCEFSVKLHCKRYDLHIKHLTSTL